jgi:Fe-S cluster assembly protein SufD
MGAFDTQAAARFGAVSAAPSWLQALRDSGRAAWLAGELPTRRTEAWKYTGLEALRDHDYLHEAEVTAQTEQAAQALLPPLDADRIVFVNGKFSERLSRLEVQPGVDIVRFAEANSAQRALIAAHAGTLASHVANPFVALATSWMHDGVLLHVRPGTRMKRPLAVFNADVAAPRPFAYAQRLLTVVDAQAEAELIEYNTSGAVAQHSLNAGVTEIALAPGARLRHARLHLEEEHALHIGVVHAQLQSTSRYESFLFGLGGRLKRVDLQVRHMGEGSECRLDGVYLAKRSQHIDFHTCVEHVAARAITQQVYRGIVDDNARAVFNGRIHIHPQAQKSNADLSNRNLLLSSDAEIDTKPELEIYADDVKCSHGATVSQIADQALYYLRTRGIDLQEARLLLGFGFINELIDGLADARLASGLRDVVREWFDTDGRLKRHLV